MFDFLNTFNLFPYTQLWRIGKEPKHNNKCSTIISILILLAIGAILVNILVTVFKMNSIIVSSQTIVSETPPLTSVTTRQTDTNLHPFMFAFDYLSGNPQLNASSLPFNITAYTDNVTGGLSSQNRTSSTTPINLEKCTPQHFSSFLQIQNKFSLWNAANWFCLPLN